MAALDWTGLLWIFLFASKSFNQTGTRQTNEEEEEEKAEEEEDEEEDAEEGICNSNSRGAK